MQRTVVSCFAIAAAVLFTGAVAAQDTFAYGIEGPDKIIGPKGGTASASYTCTMSHSGIGDGAQGWVMIMEAENARFTSISLAGTDAEANLNTDVIVIAPGFEIECNFVVTNVAADGSAACSAVVLSLCSYATLPANTTSSIAVAEVEVDIPETKGNAEATIRYTDRPCFLGPAAENIVTQLGMTRIPALGEKTIKVRKPEEDDEDDD